MQTELSVHSNEGRANENKEGIKNSIGTIYVFYNGYGIHELRRIR